MIIVERESQVRKILRRIAWWIVRKTDSHGLIYIMFTCPKCNSKKIAPLGNSILICFSCKNEFGLSKAGIYLIEKSTAQKVQKEDGYAYPLYLS